MLTLTSNNPEETKAIGETLAKSVRTGHSIGLTGELGAGKTQFVKGLARGLKIDEDEVVSPSFGLINEYEGDKKLYHVDLYRLESNEEIETLGLADYIWGDGICVIEWADRLGKDLSLLDLHIHIEILPDNRRRFTFSGIDVKFLEKEVKTLLKERLWH